MTVRFVEPSDIEALGDYFQALSRRSNYNRFLGATRELPEFEIARILHTGEANHFAVIGVISVDDVDRIVCEARYAFDPKFERCEFGLSVADAWQGLGIGSALLANLECRAAAVGASSLFGDTFRTNEEMRGLARKAGFAFAHAPGDWTLVRAQKRIALAPRDIPCVRWREVAPILAAAG
jgi:GNAT superfamily N-acetyltransferase